MHIKKALFIFFLFLFCSPVSSLTASAEYTLRYERMWPALEEPWYFNYPCDIELDMDGNVYIVDRNNHRIVKANKDGHIIQTWGVNGTGEGEFSYPVGIAISDDGFVYVSDSGNCRIQKFDSNGRFISSWGSQGSGAGQFGSGEYIEGPADVDIGPDGNLYIMDPFNSRIQKFSPDGEYITHWGSRGVRKGQFGYSKDWSVPCFLAIDGDGNIYVADALNNRVQVFSHTGEFISTWRNYATDNKPVFFKRPWSVTCDKKGHIYISYGGNYHSALQGQVDKLTTGGTLVESINLDNGTEDTHSPYPFGIAVSPKNLLYISDLRNRICIIDQSSGTNNDWGSALFNDPQSIAADQNGDLFILNMLDYDYIVKCNSSGDILNEWKGSYGDFYFDLAVDGNGNVYVAGSRLFNWSHYFIKKFDSQGNFHSQITHLDRPLLTNKIAADSAGNLYAAFDKKIIKYNEQGRRECRWFTDCDIGEITTDQLGDIYITCAWVDRVIKYSPNGDILQEWDFYELLSPYVFYYDSKFAVDASGDFILADRKNHRLVLLDPDSMTCSFFGSYGFGAGSFNGPADIAIGTSGKYFVAENGSNRIQVFTKEELPPADQSDSDNETGSDNPPDPDTDNETNNKPPSDPDDETAVDPEPFPEIDPADRVDKAVIVAGGGPYRGNSLWDATQFVSNFAYRSLTMQGFTKDTIFYLTPDANIDLDGNQKLDDVDDDATNENLQYAITQWAYDAQDLVVYITNHGDEGTFGMNEFEIMRAEDLDAWLDELQRYIPGTVTVLYDACYAGSFLPLLIPPDGKRRIVITSSAADEPAGFLNEGALSFSFYFWGFIFNGAPVWDAFVSARDAMIGFQTALLDDSGDGLGSQEMVDGLLARDHIIGNGIAYAGIGDIPRIEAVSPDQVLGADETTATIWVENAVSLRTITRVWAVVVPPDSGERDTSQPLLELPSFDLAAAGGNRYETAWGGFDEPGEYRIMVYATDDRSSVSLPLETAVTKQAGQ